MVRRNSLNVALWHCSPGACGCMRTDESPDYFVIFFWNKLKNVGKVEMHGRGSDGRPKFVNARSVEFTIFSLQNSGGACGCD
mmetsp:Transcript_8058/g.12987  ORF Transcript_8058/g.12987 Transcript_8058/m.12987 type:complete len:82 (-) Transcript_8058:284-529(-)